MRKLWINSIPPPYYCKTGFTFEPQQCDQEIEKCQPQTECLTCPENGLCDDQGKLICVEGYKFILGHCVEDQEINLKAEEIGNRFITILRKLKGNYICGNSEFEFLTFGRLLNDI